MGIFYAFVGLFCQVVINDHRLKACTWSLGICAREKIGLVVTNDIEWPRGKMITKMLLVAILNCHVFNKKRVQIIHLTWGQAS